MKRGKAAPPYIIKERLMTYQIVSERQIRSPCTVKKPLDAYTMVKRYAKAKQESFLVLTVNGAHEPISISIVHIGTVNKTVVHPREVFYKAIKDLATAIIVCHNHPSGLLEPSKADLDITIRLHEAGTILGIQVLDHLIISKNGYFSFSKEGLLPKDTDEEPCQIKHQESCM
jgi:DNA repair protein RadC